MSYIDYLIQLQESRYQTIRQYRDYADGEHTDYMTDDQRKLLVGTDGSDNPNTAPEVKINVCDTIDAEADRLQVKGFTVTAPDNEALSADLTRRAWRIWKNSRMDEGQQNVHYCGCRDGDAYMVQWFNAEANEARITFNRQYDGESSGIDMLYEDDDTSQPIAAVKAWIVKRSAAGLANTGRILRQNKYFPNRVEKYITNDAGLFTHANWRPLRDGDDGYDAALQLVELTDDYGHTYSATVEWLTDNGREDGEPLGIPVSHFRHQSRGEANGRSTLAQIVPGVQDAINMSGLSLLAAELLSGFRVRYAIGLDPETSTIKLYPGAMIYNREPDGSFGEFGETNLVQLQDTLNTWIKLAATLTKTPLTFFNQTGQIPAEGTQQQIELALIAKTRTNQTTFGNAYEDAIRYALKLEAIYGDLKMDLAMLDDLEISCEWEPAQVRNEISCEWEPAQVRNERDETEMALLRYEKASIPQEQVWKELGYSPEEIDQFTTAADVKRNQAMGALTQRLQEMDAANRAQQIAGTGVTLATDAVSTTTADNPELPSNIESDKGLNGAQITAALDILAGVTAGTTPAGVAFELLKALGISEDRARKMVDETVAQSDAIREARNATPDAAAA